MNILHICSISNNKTSGVSNVVPEHFINQKKFANVAILNCNSTIIEKLNGQDNVFYYKDFKKINKIPFKPDIAIFHSFYIPLFIKLALELSKLEIPYIIIPHGSLTMEAQNQKKLKKRIANILFYNKFIKDSEAIQYLSESEKDQSRNINKKSIVLGNGIMIPKKQKKEFNDNGIKMIYIGRYSIYTKGIDLIFEFVNNNINFFINNKISIDLYGAGADGIEEVKKLLNEENSKIITIYGPIFGVEKEKELLNHDVFVQLSRHEGQPLGIMEAMAYGLPILVSDGTTFKNVAVNDCCGILFDDLTIENIRDKFLNKESLKKMSLNCVEKISNSFSWSIISKQSVNLYEEIRRGKC